MTSLQEALLQIRTDLTALGLPWALIGGLAVSLRAVPRTTVDVDVVVAIDSDREAEEVVISLRNRGYRELPDGGVLLHRQRDRLVGVRLLPPIATEQRTIVDVLFASSGIEPEIVAGAELLMGSGGLLLPVIRRGHLIALKVLAGRPQDLADAEALLRAAQSNDVDEARQALLLIERRGFNADKDLQVELAKLLDTRP